MRYVCRERLEAVPLLVAKKFAAMRTVFEHEVGVALLSQCHRQRCVVSLCARLLCVVMFFHGLFSQAPVVRSLVWH